MVLLLLLGLVSPAQEAGVAERLNHDGWKAVEALSEQPKLRPELEKLAEGGDEELRWWAGATLSEIDARSHGAVYVGARRVTLEAKGRTAREVLSELLAPDRLRLAGDLKAAEKPVDLSFRDVPVFQALDDVCREADCALFRNPDGTLEVRTAPDKTERPGAYAGPLAVTFTGRTFLTTADFQGPPQSRLQVELAVRMDPRIWLRYHLSGFRFVSAKEDSGKALEVSELNGWGASATRQPYTITLKPSLSAPTAEARSIRFLRGIATLQVGKISEEVGFDDVGTAAGQTREVGALRITLRSFALEDRRYTAILDYAPKDYLGAPEIGDVLLLDAKGKPFPGCGGESGNGTIVSRFDASRFLAREPARLRMEVPTGLHPRKIYFEIRDIPLR